jgi:hypothetical protein
MRNDHCESAFQGNAIVAGWGWLSEMSDYSENRSLKSDASERQSLPVLNDNLSIVQMRRTVNITRPVAHFQQRGDRLRDFVDRYCFHAAKVDGAFSQKAGTAFDLMANHVIGVSERAGELRFRRTKDSDDGNPKDRREMHRAGVVGEQQVAFAQLGDELIHPSFADTIDAVDPDRCFDGRADLRVSGCAEQNPLNRMLCGDRNRNRGEAFWKPPLGRPVFGARAEADLCGRAI